MNSFDNLSSSLGSISSALALLVSRGRHGKLVDNFSHELDVMSLQNPFTSLPYKTPSCHVPTRPLSIFTTVFPVKSREAFSSNSMSNIRHLLLVSANCSLRHCCVCVCACVCVCVCMCKCVCVCVCVCMCVCVYVCMCVCVVPKCTVLLLWIPSRIPTWWSKNIHTAYLWVPQNGVRA